MKITKEVYYNVYCKKCKYKDLDESEDPCDSCLGIPYGINTHKPSYFVQREGDYKNE